MGVATVHLMRSRDRERFRIIPAPNGYSTHKAAIVDMRGGGLLALIEVNGQPVEQNGWITLARVLNQMDSELEFVKGQTHQMARVVVIVESFGTAVQDFCKAAADVLRIGGKPCE